MYAGLKLESVTFDTEECDKRAGLRLETFPLIGEGDWETWVGELTARHSCAGDRSRNYSAAKEDKSGLSIYAPL